MPSPDKQCPQCGGRMSPKARLCRQCAQPYERTPEDRQRMSERLRGVPKPLLRGRKRPEHSRQMKEWWTPERRQAKREEMMKRNPETLYHGKSHRAFRLLREAIGKCERCGDDRPASQLDVHHRNRDKRDHSLPNLIVLCHRCHMQDHASRGETGWHSYHRKRKMSRDSA